MIERIHDFIKMYKNCIIILILFIVFIIADIVIFILTDYNKDLLINRVIRILEPIIGIVSGALFSINIER